MFVGYSVHCANHVYRMLNLDTKRIIQSRDIIWLCIMIGLIGKFRKRGKLMMKIMMSFRIRRFSRSRMVKIS
jgi:hypothetical protein